MKKILFTRYAAKTPVKVAPWMIATNIRSVTKVPMFAGRKLFMATPTAYAVTIGHSCTPPSG